MFVYLSISPSLCTLPARTRMSTHRQTNLQLCIHVCASASCYVLHAQPAQVGAIFSSRAQFFCHCPSNAGVQEATSFWGFPQIHSTGPSSLVSPAFGSPKS